MLKPFPSFTKKNPFGSKTINKNSLINTDLTGSLLRIEEPIKKQIVEYRPNNIGVKTNNTKRKILDNRKSIFQYSARQIEKQITGFDESQNKLYIINTILDYGTEAVSSDNFELFYNGATVPFIYRVEQVGTTIEITFLEEYINYESLTLPQIFVVGKFK